MRISLTFGQNYAKILGNLAYFCTTLSLNTQRKIQRGGGGGGGDRLPSLCALANAKYCVM